MILETRHTLELLHARGIRTATAIDAHAHVVTIAVECSDDLMLGRTIEIRGAGRAVDRLAPVGPDEAATMAGEFCATLGFADGCPAVRALSELIVRAEGVFATDGVARIVLDPVRLHDDACDVVDATIEARRAIPIRRRRVRHVRETSARLPLRG